MNILFVAAELAPHAKVGGLADVAAALPQALAAAGHSVSVAVPLHRSLKKSGEFRRTNLELPVPVANGTWASRVWQGRRGGVSLYAIERDEYFDRAHPYGEGGGDYPDSLDRFVFFSRAALELARHIEPVPEILHANDWHTALIPALVSVVHLPMRTVFTIHNLRYQGEFPGSDFPRLGLPGEMFRPETLEFYGKVNLLKGAILLAHEVTTVSPSYAREIQTEAFGHGLHEVLQGRAAHLSGILNGIDEESWNPESDVELKKNFSSAQPQGREDCRAALEKEMGLEPANGRPIFGMVTRLAEDKGVDLALGTAKELVKKGGRLVVLGKGQTELEEAAKALEKNLPGRVAVRLEHNEGLARRIFAGADFFLMPSRSEPCGLTQMYAMRYGAIPVVADTGGLHDSVQPKSAAKKSGCGIRFPANSVTGLRKGLDQALAWWDEPARIEEARQDGMRRDWGWGAAVPAYDTVYRSSAGLSSGRKKKG
ncbi:MAG: glycogen synthase GlgA [Verrucomicrobia bacterium]|nr:glycogen synthase GlgA [Verrucomicrobiota bacterium]